MASLSAVCGSLGVIRHRVSRDAARTQCRHFFARGWRPAQASRSEYSTVTTGLHSCISCKVYCSVRRAVKLRTADTRDTDSRSLPHYTTPPGPVHRLGVPSEGQGNGKAEATTRAELASTCERGVSTTSLAVRDTISRGGTPSS